MIKALEVTATVDICKKSEAMKRAVRRAYAKIVQFGTIPQGQGRVPLHKVNVLPLSGDNPEELRLPLEEGQIWLQLHREVE